MGSYRPGVSNLALVAGQKRTLQRLGVRTDIPPRGAGTSVGHWGGIKKVEGNFFFKN